MSSAMKDLILYIGIGLLIAYFIILFLEAGR